MHSTGSESFAADLFVNAACQPHGRVVNVTVIDSELYDCMICFHQAASLPRGNMCNGPERDANDLLAATHQRECDRYHAGNVRNHCSNCLPSLQH